jgi:hypothetical protein
VVRGVTLLAALALGASFACGRAVSADDEGLENAVPGAQGTGDPAAPLDCPPTRVYSDESKSTVSGSAVNTMDALCGECHAPDAAEPAPAGPLVATDFNRMIDEGFVVDCDAERSPIIISMRANEMPPLSYFGIQATTADIDRVAYFIEFLCSDEQNACAERPSEPGCDEVLAARRAQRCAW